MNTCGECNSNTAGLTFCPVCGADCPDAPAVDDSPTVVTAETTSEDSGGRNPAGDQAPAAGAKRPSPLKRTIVWAAIAAVLAAGFGVASFAYVRNSQEEKAREAAAAVAATTVSQTVAQLAAAQTTADIRQTAALAGSQQAAMAGQGSDDPRITAAQQALAAVADLKGINGDSLDQWDQHRPTIDSAVRRVTVNGAQLDPSVALSDVDQMVENAEKALAEWQLKANYIAKTTEESTQQLNAYESTGSDQLTRYNGIRNDTARWWEGVKSSSYVSPSSTSSYLQQALADRQSVRNTFSDLDPPDALKQQHNEVLAGLNLGIDGINALIGGIPAMSSCSSSSSCPISRNSGFTAFVNASSTNTARYDRAYEAWLDAVAAYRASLETTTTNVPKPEV